MTYLLMRQAFEDGYQRWLVDFEDGGKPCWLPLFWRDKRGRREPDMLHWTPDPGEPDDYGFGEIEIDSRVEQRLEEYRTDRIIEEKRIKAAQEADDKALQRKSTESVSKKKRIQRPSQFSVGAREQLGFDFDTGRPVYGVVMK